jgi:sorting nexin-29
LKINKAAASNNISPELLKHGGRTLKQNLYKLILMIQNNQQLPQQWNEGIICPVYKKGDRLNCNNYRPITLLNIAYKIFAVLLNERLIEIIENKLVDNQMGFCPNRSTIDNIFIVRQIFEKSHEHNSDLYNIFVAYPLAFDSVYSNQRIECLKKFDVPDKLIRLIALTLIHTRVRVKVNRDFTEEFIVKCGVRQGDPLSATLFSLVIDTILKQMELRGNITTHLEQCTVYADDILLTTRTKRSLIDTFQKLKEISAHYGLIVNGQKTKYLVCTRKTYRVEELQINSMYLEQVQSYKYLGSTVNRNNSIEEEIQYRITLGNKFKFDVFHPEVFTEYIG